MKLVFATHNQGKLKEMRDLLSDLSIEVVSADEAGVYEDVIEDGTTFKANALKKARFVGEQTGEWAVADDSGICIDALDGEPGVYSARWAGDRASVIDHTLAKMKKVPVKNRGAHFVSTLALFSPDGLYWIFEGQVSGHITLEPRGKNRPGLPYDLIFVPEGYDKTFAEMSDEQKNSLSHRGNAFAKLKIFLQNYNK